MSRDADETRPDGGEPRPRAAIASGASADSAEVELPFGGAIGRYLVLSVLGHGGMGVVYAAFDPVLDRRIAVKLLREPLDADGTEGRSRMRREAQALARLSHPNIVAVHDVGEHHGAMYIAMELVDGATLAEWQEGKEGKESKAGKDWRAIVDVYCAAARGLAAAHAAGLIHRDFKPDNVLVGRDGRVRVTDFGLARLAAEPDTVPDRATEPSAPSPGSQLATSLTVAGTVMGTPRYMAPEQIEGGAVDARTDQFAWAIALWEALYGEQPFPTSNLALRAAAMQVDVPKVPGHPEVPRAVGRALLRGIAARPAARWPTLDALVDELQRVTAPRKLIAGAAAAGGMAVLAVGFLLARGGSGGAAAGPTCEDTGAALEAVWSPAARQAAAEGFRATGAPYAADAFAQLDRAIGAWLGRWRAQALDSCRATRVSGTQPEAAMDLRSACLARRRDELAAQLAVLGRADRKLVERAHGLALPDLDACSDTAVLAGTAPPPTAPAERAAREVLETELLALEGELAQGVSLERAQAIEATGPALTARATELGWQPALARTRQVLAAAQRERGQGKPARASLVSAAAAAAAAADADRLLSIYRDLADVETRLTSEFALGESWLALAEGTLARLGPRPDVQQRIHRQRGKLAYKAGRFDDAKAAYEAALPLARAQGPTAELGVLADLGQIEAERGELDTAVSHLERAREIARAELGPLHPLVAGIDHDLGGVDYRRGKYAAAEARYRSALAVREQAYGPDDLAVAITAEGLGIALLGQGRMAEAHAQLERSISVSERRLGAEHPDFAAALNAIGGAYHRAGDYERELATNERALAIREKALGPDHPDVAASLINTAIASKSLGRWDIVLPRYERALAIMTKAHGAMHIRTGIARLNYAEALRVRGRLDEAAPAYEAARAAFVQQFGEDHPLLGHYWNGVGQLELARGRTAAALPLLERAVALREKDPGDAPALAESRFALARALGKTSPRGRDLAARARDAFRDGGEPFRAQRDEIDAWLR